MKTHDYIKRVVRSDGTVEHDWKVVHRYTYRDVDRVVMEKVGDDGYVVIKRPTLALYLHWQEGGLCRSQEELDTNLPTKS